MRFRDERERQKLGEGISQDEVDRVLTSEEIVPRDSAIFCATGISDVPLLRGEKLIGKVAITHSMLMRAGSQTARSIRAVHNLERKSIHLRRDRADHRI